MTRAVVYTRISADREGAGLGVERQRQDCEALAEMLGWTIVETFADNDISAYSGKPRPGYLAMLDTLEAGNADAVLAWHADRLHRSPAELEGFIDLCDRKGVVVRTVQAGEIDLSTPSGKMTARIVGAVARHEIDHARQRMVAAHAQSAKNGGAHGRVPYGYRAVREGAKVIARVPDEETAPVVREIARRVMAGESLYSIAADLTERKISTPGSSEAWRASIMKQMMVRPTYAGMRSHHGVVTQGSWEPLISPEDHAVIVSLLNDPKRKTHRGVEPKYLLSGIAKCGVCGDPVWRLKSNGHSAYACAKNRCVSRRVEPVDRLIEAAVISKCESMSGVEDLVDASVLDATQEARRLRAQLDSFVDRAAEGELTAASLSRIEARLLPQIREAEQRAKSVLNPLVTDLLGSNARSRWEAMSVTSRRHVVRSLMSVTINRGGRGRAFRPEFVRVEWL
ncbi:recombinase family protein [Rhodococcus tibetensis]|uniref:Recombinase family protein n=1 Tax=Rhodococcus tibetensis TaxID=2965064 RepID=A0ABT1QDW7_9NOCA|nr:recombinase family protein [Rhodococcus sp. FXJ9.536]MCQ4119848.1 recombinase family protein [Rhodococcus sp. FXJ9.536]